MHWFDRFGYVDSASKGFRRMRIATLTAVLIFLGNTVAMGEGAAEPKEPTVRLIGATALVTEVSTGLPLSARVDTGATSCSIHCESFEIKDADPDPKVNIGKPVRFLIKKDDGTSEWVEAKIVDYVKVRTSEREDDRYKVSLRLRCDDVEKKVHVTLNDRQSMKYPLLLGRNFLRDDFLVNVSLTKSE
jgi:hypothetical protein